MRVLSTLLLGSFVLLNQTVEAMAAGEENGTDPRPSAAQVFTFYSPDGQAAFEPQFEPYRDGAGTVVRLSREIELPFTQFGRPLGPDTLHYKYYKTAVERFPDVKSCIADGQRHLAQPDLTEFDWPKFQNSKFAEVCLFRIATSYQSAKDFESWLASQGFITGSGYILDYRPDRNYPNSLDFQVYGRWSVREKGALIYRDQNTKTEIEKHIRSYTTTLEIRVGFGILEISAGYDYP